MALWFIEQCELTNSFHLNNFINPINYFIPISNHGRIFPENYQESTVDLPY